MSTELVLFQAALGLPAPWRVMKIDFQPDQQELHLFVDFAKGAKFACPVCQKVCSVYDTDEDKVWRHLNFFQHKAFLHARFPRIDCHDCGVKTIQAPWARDGSGFTLLFEALVISLAGHMSVLSIAKMVEEHDTVLWRIVNHYAEQGREQEDMSHVRRIGIDETSVRKGHNYLTLVADHDQARVLFATQGKDAQAVKAFSDDLLAHQGAPDQITAVTSDLSPAFAKGVRATFAHAIQIADRFHVMQLANNALDQVRRAEVKTDERLKKTRYLWLKNASDLKPRECALLKPLLETELLTVRTYALKERLGSLWSEPDEAHARLFAKQWCDDADQSGIPAMVTVGHTIRTHLPQILGYFATTPHLTNALLEGINGLVQAAKDRARGYRNPEYFKNIIYLIQGKLELRLPILNGG